MRTGEYIRTLGEFVSGDLELSTFNEFVENRLFELRKDLEMTDEKRLLSSIELYLHEAEEGQRSGFEVYAHVQSILDNIILSSSTSEGITERLAPVFPKIPYLLSKYFDIDLAASEQKQTVVQLVTSK